MQAVVNHLQRALGDDVEIPADSDILPTIDHPDSELPSADAHRRLRNRKEKAVKTWGKWIKSNIRAYDDEGLREPHPKDPAKMRFVAEWEPPEVEPPPLKRTMTTFPAVGRYKPQDNLRVIPIDEVSSPYQTGVPLTCPLPRRSGACIKCLTCA